MNSCDHVFKFIGLVYSYEDYPLPGSGAYSVIYEDKFFCEKCLQTAYKNPRVIGNSYGKRIEGSFPK